jgi:L-aspartate oxidase
LEGLVFGARAGKAMIASARKSAVKSPEIQSVFEKNRMGCIGQKSVFPALLETATARLKETMWNRVGIVRDHSSLTDALKVLEKWKSLTAAPVVSQLEGEFKNRVTVASMIVRAALLRKHSIGAHYRSDDPKPGTLSEPRHIAFRLSDHPQGDWV